MDKEKNKIIQLNFKKLKLSKETRIKLIPILSMLIGLLLYAIAIWLSGWTPEFGMVAVAIYTLGLFIEFSSFVVGLMIQDDSRKKMEK